MGGSDFVGWLRNKDRQPWALCVPYQMNGIWKSYYPDFLIFSRKGEKVVVDIIDPHLTSMDDARFKAAGLASFADRFHDRFVRIDLIVVEKPGELGQMVKRLRLMEEKVRKKVKGVESNQHVKDLFDYEGLRQRKAFMF
jgi:type III restriction enzyme